MFSSGAILLASAVSALAVALPWARKVMQNRAKLGNYPGRYWIPLDPLYPIGILLSGYIPPRGWIGDYWARFTRWWLESRVAQMADASRAYSKVGSTLIASISASNGRLAYWTSDAETIKLVSADRHNFIKDIASYEVIGVYGDNLASSEGDTWKRHRGIVKGAFSEANNALVWKDTMRVLREFFAELDRKPKTRAAGTLVDLTAIMSQITFLVIASAGFGQRIAWTADALERPPPGHRMTFKDSLLTALGGIFVRAVLPGWMLRTPHVPIVSRVGLAYEELRLHLTEMVSDARADFQGKTRMLDDKEASLFRKLVEANGVGGADEQLSDNELLSNVFVFLLAGHETSAHTLAFAFCLLALYPEVQERLRREVESVWPNGTWPTDHQASYKSDYPRLEYALAVFWETLRLFPAEERLWKIVQSDTTLPYKTFTPDGQSEQRQFSAPKDSIIVLDMMGAHMNPLHWGSDVNEFRPERFLETADYKWPRDAFMPFALGPRACVGQRFAMAESVAVLALVTRAYEILPPPGLVGKTLHEQQEELLRFRVVATLTPTNARVLFRRRNA